MKRQHRDKPTKRTISIPQSLSNKVDIYLHDPIAGKLKYGAFGDLVASLLRRHFAELSTETATLDELMANAIANSFTSEKLLHMLTELTAGTPYTKTQDYLLSHIENIAEADKEIARLKEENPDAIH